jgi:hypothetical protein
VIEKLTRFDTGMLVAAVVMALGAFCPIVRFPIVGSINYVMDGRGDGVFIIGCSAAIIALVVTGYRRTTGIVAAGALFLMLTTMVQVAVKLSEAQASLAKDKGPFSGLSTLIANSVGLEWGWVLLIGGALSVIVLAMLTPYEGIAPKPDVNRHKSQEDEGGSFSSADKIIADYLESRKISPAMRNQSTPQQSGFGKRTQ